MPALSWWSVFLVFLFATVAGFGFALGNKIFSKTLG